MVSLLVGGAAVVAAFVLGVLALRTVDRHLAGRREIYRLHLQTLVETKQVAEGLAVRDAEIDSMTIEEAAELKKAQLRKDAAELRAEAAVIEETTQDLVEERRRVITARTEGAELAARDEGLHGGDEHGETERLKLLVEAYKAYCAAGGEEDWEDWIGDFEY